ncbi:hypothetical protein O9993_00900 [Vibrio lentus]|nr:hypothetical protein [Vibrio lentus]
MVTMTQHTHSSMIDTERIGRLLKLEGIDLLESAVLTLHRKHLVGSIHQHH